MKKTRRSNRTGLLSAIIFLFAAFSMDGATLTVNSAADAGGTCPGTNCTLRQAIASAANGDTINFSLPANTAIKLSTTKLFLNKSLTINGPGANLLTLQRDVNSGAQLRIFETDVGTNSVISGLTISKGNDQIGCGIYNSGTLTVMNCAISENSAIPTGNQGEGAGITNIGTLTVLGCTISGNFAEGLTGVGGGISNSGTLTVASSTLSGNMANFRGAAIYNSGKITITNSTITGNTITSHNSGTSAGGIYHSNGIAGSAASIRSTIVARNTADTAPDLFGPVTSQGYNLIGNNKDASTAATTGDQIGTSAAPIDPMLGPLQDNGGPTKTHALLDGSKAIDKGDSGGFAMDQRGFNRPVDTPSIINAGDGADVGAYEVQADQLAGCSQIIHTVNNLADSGPGSLRAVIATVCSGSTIDFAANVRGTINLTSGELVLNKNLTINGPGANLLSIERSPTAVTNFRIFHINGNFNDAISGLTIAKGFMPGNLGGGISNDNGTLTLDGVTVSGSTADIGAGIYTARAANIHNSTISGNTVSGNNLGDGGGAIYNVGGTLDLVNSTLFGNVAQLSGGGGQGGGIRSQLGAVNITSTTISGNSADQGGGVYQSNGGSVTFRNSIIARNTSPVGPDLNGTFTSNGFNLFGDATLAAISPAHDSDQTGDANSPINPMLGPLRNNGGPTFTLALLSGSSAIDKGDSSGSSTDQRGLPRPSDDPAIPNAVSLGDGSDIGAFERQVPPPSPTPSPTPTATATPKATPTATATPTAAPGHLGNVSTRLQVGTGNNVLFAGFIIQGSASKTVLIRSAGPSLTSFGVPGAMANPQLELHDAKNLIGANNNWQTTEIGGVITSNQVAAIQNSGAAPSNPAEPAIIATLAAGSYTAIVQGVGGTQGVATVEVYDLSPNNGAILANISTRGFIQTGDNVMIGGFIDVGHSSRVLIRATGPSLAAFGINNPLANPRIELHDANGALAANDNWQTTQLGGIITSDQSAAIQNSGLAPSNQAESAIIATLAPGSYTAIAQGVNGGTGVGVIEVFALP